MEKYLNEIQKILQEDFVENKIVLYDISMPD